LREGKSRGRRFASMDIGRQRSFNQNGFSAAHARFLFTPAEVDFNLTHIGFVEARVLLSWLARAFPFPLGELSTRSPKVVDAHCGLRSPATKLYPLADEFTGFH
jgi:hypothetical protein